MGGNRQAPTATVGACFMRTRVLGRPPSGGGPSLPGGRVRSKYRQGRFDTALAAS